MLLGFYYIDQSIYLGEPEEYIGKVEPYSLSEYGIPLEYYDMYYLYSKMNDPYTFYLDPTRAAKYWDSINYSEPSLDAGFDWEMNDSTGEFIIIKVTKNSPADKAGIKAGDVIMAIDGTAPTNATVFDKLTHGSEGETITFTVKRDDTSLDIQVVLETYYTPTVELSFKDSIPVIKILEFTPQTSNDSGTYGEFMAYLRETENYKSTIIDMRDNGGGDGDQCFSMSQEFLSIGDSCAGVISTYADTITRMQGLDTTFLVNERDGFAKDRYIVFLANDLSASCSEVLLLSVLQNKKFPIVGTTTYGKGIGQVTTSTPTDAIAHITAMRVIDKNFNTYHKYGFEPDFKIFDENLALEKAVELAKEGSHVRTAGYGNTNTGHFAKSAETQDTMPGFYMMPREKRKHSFLKQDLIRIIP